ncbi:nucleotidyltransferase domain-containing protein, partial [bacterium AH-315-K05]|nr:nucleotidyltransferase domain-containing protein [bacterium AH-315-K05]MBN4070042.1 nucleotidyltransferase domain-containing protein [bacterium AH-315-G05]
MRFGIAQKSMSMIIDVLQKNKEVSGASIFGSRAMGNYKTGSDVDDCRPH